jgi:hypothetical protein
MPPDAHASPVEPGPAAPARPHVPTSAHPCPACPASDTRAGCSACLGRGRIWLPVELEAHPDALAGVLGDLAVHGRTATRPLPGARLAADGQVHYGTWHGLRTADLPPGDARRRLWLVASPPPSPPVALRLFDPAPTTADAGRPAGLEPAGPAPRPSRHPAVVPALPGRPEVEVEHRFAARGAQRPADGRRPPPAAPDTPRDDLLALNASSDPAGGRTPPAPAGRRARPR